MRSRVHAWARHLLDRIDPNDDPSAEPLSIAGFIALLVLIGVSLSAFFSFRVQPMQDLGHHLALAAVNVDRGKPGSIFTELYEPLDVLSANSLMYTLAVPLAKLMKVTTAVRLMIAFYLAGVPLATAWSLRVYGRSVWPSVLATAFVYNMVYVAGFANLLFAAPFMVVALPILDRCLERRTAGWVAAAALNFVIVFLSHAHGFLWTGFLCALLVVGRSIEALSRTHRTWRARAREVGTLALLAVTAVAPSLILFARWYGRTFGDARRAGGVMAATATSAEKFGAYWKKPGEVLSDLVTVTLKWFESDDADLRCVMMVMVLLAFALAFGRLQRHRRPPILELACAITLASYFVLPEGLTGHDVLASRQVSLALWFAPVFFTPVAPRVSRAARLAVVAGTLWVAGQMHHTWRKHLVMFSRETNGLMSVLSQAPPRLWLHYVKTDNASTVFTWWQFMHVDKYYSSESFGQIADTPAILSTAAMRYRAGVDIHRIAEHTHSWPSNGDVWKNFDLILIRRWKPSDADLALAKKNGTLIASQGDWQLWRSNVVQRDSSSTSEMPPPNK